MRDGFPNDGSFAWRTQTPAVVFLVQMSFSPHGMFDALEVETDLFFVLKSVQGTCFRASSWRGKKKNLGAIAT